MRLTMAVLACFIAAGTLSAQTITLDTKTDGLLPGTHVRVKVEATLFIVQPPAAPKPGERVAITDAMIRYRETTETAEVWDFRVPMVGKVPAPTLILKFSKPIPPVAKGQVAGLRFHLLYTIEPPAGSTWARVVDRPHETTLRLPATLNGPIGCLRVEQPTPEGTIIAVVPDCTMKLEPPRRQ